MGQNSSRLSLRSVSSQYLSLSETGVTTWNDENNTVDYMTLKTRRDECIPFRLIARPTNCFVDREELLENLHHLLISCSSQISLWDRIVVIQGPGGMGKSELVRKYVEKYIDDKIIQNVAWINADTEGSLKNSFQSIASKFRLRPKCRDIASIEAKDIAESVFKYFSKNFASGLFIFDNVEQLENDELHYGISKCLPTQEIGLPLIIIISGSDSWEVPNNIKSTLKIPKLDDIGSEKLLTTLLNLKENQENNTKIQTVIQNLAQVLQGYPLGIALAAANICCCCGCNEGVNTAHEIQRYIELLKKTKSEYLNDAHSGELTCPCYHVLHNVWRAAIETMKEIGKDGDCAITLLNIMTFLPTGDIRKSIVDQIFEFGDFEHRDKLSHGYNILNKLSLISFVSQDENQNVDEAKDADISIIHSHDQVQRCIRESLDSIGDHSYLLCVGRFICEDREGCDMLMQHYIHRQLKQRKWPDCSIIISIFLLCDELRIARAEWGELAIDLIEALEKDDQTFPNLLSDEQRTLIEVSLYICSATYLHRKPISDTQRCQWNTKYAKTFGTALKLLIYPSTLHYNTNWQGIYSGLVNKLKSHLTDIDFSPVVIDKKTMFNAMLDTCLKTLKDPTVQNSSFIFSLIYKFLCKCCLFDGGKNAEVCLKNALHLHLKYYTKYSSLRTEKYWISGPFNCFWIRKQLHLLRVEESTDPSLATALEKSIVDVFVNHGGPQIVQHYFEFIRSNLSNRGEWGVLELLMSLSTKYNCADELKKAPQFLYSLRELTEVTFSEEAKRISEMTNHVLLVLVWFALFPGNSSFQETEEKKWSLDSVDKEIKKCKRLIKEPNFCKNTDDLPQSLVFGVLRTHLKKSESNAKDGWIFETAVEVMDQDIRSRLDMDYDCDEWKAEFENWFRLGENTPKEILEVGMRHGFITELLPSPTQNATKSHVASLFTRCVKSNNY